MNKISLIILFIMLLFPSFSNLENCYQDSLWTSHTLSRSTKTNDIIFGIGGKFDEIKIWHRLRLGLPAKAITIDCQSEEKIIQGRIEPDYIILNLLLGCTLIFIFWLFRKLYFNLKK